MTTTSATSTCLRVEISADRLRATLNLSGTTKGEGASSVTEDAVLDALDSSKIEITDAVKQHVTKFVELVGDGETAQDFLVAKGRAAIEGKDEAFVLSKEFQTEADSWQGDAPVNYYETSSIITVQEGDIVGSITPVEPSRDGIDVTGKVISAKGEPKALVLDLAVFTRPAEKPTQVITKIAGHLVCDGDSLTIQEVLTVPGDVDFECGNVDSTVSVHIKGRVLDRFTVRSAGSITVCKAIEAAHVEAAGDVTVKQGILGRGAGLVTAKGDIIAKFCAGAHLSALGDVKIARQLMASHICVGGQVIGTAAGLIGGCVFAGGGVEVATLGSDANVPTHLVIGVAPDLVRQVAVLQRSIRRLKELVEPIQDLLARLEHAAKPLTAEQSDRVRAMCEQAKVAEERLKTDQVRHDELMERVYTDGDHSVIVGNTIHAGTVIRIRDRETVFRKDLKGPVSIERRKIDNVTEVVAINKLTSSVTVLKHERVGIDTLLDWFELESDSQPPDRR